VAGGALVKGKNTLAGVKDGLVDAGLDIALYAVKSTPSTAVIFSTLVFGSDVVATTGAQMETALLECPSCRAEYKKNNTVFLSGYATTPFRLMCRKKIATVADLKGKKVRSTGGGAILIKAGGGIPVNITPAEATTALQRGGIDCVLGAAAWLKSYGYQDVAKHLLEYPLGMVGPPGSFTMNRRTWKKFTDEQKRIHVKYLPRVVAESALSAYIGREEVIINNAKKLGVTINKGGPGWAKLTAEHARLQRGRNIKRAKGWGVKNPGKILDAFDRNLVKWGKISKQVGRSVPKFAAALKREVYDKLDISKL
jgi:TRAP-type C4-dicarboxylate transport system substrate-binding protein